MTRDLDRLTAQTFDVLVVGGGIYGLAIAYDAAQRGLSVALIEKDDFGSGASFNHLRTIHGGLRYLQSLDVARSRESVRERRTIARIAPHAVRPLPFAVPIYRSLTRGKIAMRAGFLLDRVIAAGRNRGVPASLRLPGGKVIGRSSAIAQFPGLRRQKLTGAGVMYDYVTTEADRLVFSYAMAAAAHGAVVANHVEAVSTRQDGTRIAGVTAKDTLGAGTIEIAARLTINATGAAVDRLLTPLGIPTRIPMLQAMNLVTKRDAGEEALGGRSSAGRYLFLVPWRERALFGTWESERVADPADTAVNERDVTSFIAELNQAFPALDLSLNDLTLVHHGTVPVNELIRDHAAADAGGIDGLITVAGAKFTTARAVAERVTTLALRKLQRAAVPCRTASTPLPGGSIRDIGLAIGEARREHDAGLPSDTIPHLIAAYGSRYRDVLDLAAGHPEWRTRIAADSPVIGAELVLAARSEMALTLADAMIRRTPLGALGYPGDEAVARAGAIMGHERGWTDGRLADEIAGVKAFYGIVNALKT